MKAENEKGDTLATRNATDPPAGTKDHPGALSRKIWKDKIPWTKFPHQGRD